MKRAVFIGRYSPFHKGHLAIMKKKIVEGKPLLILVRNTDYDLYPPETRKKMIEAAMKELKADAKVEIIEDIESVNYGRGVGYEVNEIEVPSDIKRISATEIRSMIEQKNDSWRDYMPKGADDVLEKYLSGLGVVVWFTGLPKSGKSTIADLVSEMLENKSIKNKRLSSGILRKTVSQDLKFTKDDRDKNIERAAHIANMLAKDNQVVLCSFITPYESERQQLRKIINDKTQFIEVHVKASLETCKKRDDNKLYEMAERGEIENFTGVSDPYEDPINSEIVLDTETKSAEECAKDVVKYVESLL